MSDDGILILRCYIQPAVQERPEDVFAEIFREPIPSFHHFKFRLLMAMQPSTQAGIAVHEVYRYWAGRNMDTRLLTSRAGWEQSAIDTIELYRHSVTVHTFPTLAEYRSVLLEFFDEISLSSPPCNLGERCPILVLRPRPHPQRLRSRFADLPSSHRTLPAHLSAGDHGAGDDAGSPVRRLYVAGRIRIGGGAECASARARLALGRTAAPGISAPPSRAMAKADSGKAVHENPQVSWQTLDWTGVAPDERPEKLAAFLREDRERPFSLDDGVPLRLTVLQTSASSYTLIWTIHHALVDGRSRLIVWQEWFALYEGLLAGEEVQLGDPVSFREHIDWLERQDLAKAERYWRALLAGVSQTTDYVVDRIRPVIASHGESIARERVRLSAESTQELWNFARRHDVTVNTLVQGAWALLLSRYSDRSGHRFWRHLAPAGGRRSGMPARMLGVLINTLPFRIAVIPDAPLLPWLKQIREQWIALREYEHTPLDKIWEWSGLPPWDAAFRQLSRLRARALAETLGNLGGNWQHRTISRMQRTDSPLTLVAYGRPLVTLEIV